MSAGVLEIVEPSPPEGVCFVPRLRNSEGDRNELLSLWRQVKRLESRLDAPETKPEAE